MKFFTSMVWVMLAMTSAYAQDAEKLPPSVESSAGELYLCSEITLRVMGMFTIGDAGLYLSECSDYKHVTYDVAQQYSVYFNRDAKAGKLRELAVDSLDDNFTEAELAELNDIFACVYDAYQDTAKGSRVDTRYLPGEGLSLIQDDEVLAMCGDNPAGAGYFRIWFGQDPFNDKLRSSLLNGAREESEKSS